MRFFHKLSFRKKILVSYLAVLTLSIAIIFPFAGKMVKKITSTALLETTADLITNMQEAPSPDALVRRLRDQKHLFFFRVAIIGPKRNVIYDSSVSKVFGPEFDEKYVVHHPEVEQAFQHGTGFQEGYSALLDQQSLYIARSFRSHGNIYVLRAAFPLNYTKRLVTDFKIGFLSLSFILLFLSSVLTWIFFHFLTRPIQTIIEAIKPYQQGIEDHIPPIRLHGLNPNDEIYTLANTINRLSERIHTQVSTLIYERNEKEAVLESLIEGVIAVDRNLVVTYANGTALQMLGILEEEILGQPFGVAEQPTCEALLRSCQRDRKFLTDTLILERNGKVYLNIVVAPKEKSQGAILVLQDMSSHYRAFEMSKDFIANASHELKTPVTIIRGFAETLQENPDLPKQQFQEITEKIVSNSNRMASLVKDLLTLSEIENLSESQLQPCELLPLIENCEQILLSVYPDAQVNIHSQPHYDYTLLADGDLLERALYNLLSNSARYSDGPACIAITLEETPLFVTIKIADKGIGIAEKDLPHIFERFYRVDRTRSKRLGGTGLGLSIVQTIVNKHHGNIEVESIVGQGTTFTITLIKTLE